MSPGIGLEEMCKLLDLNSPGTLNLLPFEKVSMLKLYDLNKDGTMTHEELRAKTEELMGDRMRHMMLGRR